MAGLGLFQHRVQDTEMVVARVQWAQGQPEGVRDKTSERWFRETGDLRDLRDRYRGDAGFVDPSLEQPDRLLTYGSGGDE